ncbi:12656_t:CDS:1 [Ambispora leptoticha]|uniref:12656_t:CDS:1 n=1 Tax=Ambispora leptoticha TaxID=144679 RepID=A0A9N8V8I1_9GLOM|nr:12656_t:CDS:1 [Ambispora leptoticha]
MTRGNLVSSNSNNGVSPLHRLSTSTNNNITRRRANVQRKRSNNVIPQDFDISVVYKPRFNLQTLICTTAKKQRSSDKPPRPPNSFFLLKNCLLLELWSKEIKPTMPSVCVLAKRVWQEAPPEVKELYDQLSTEALKLHHSEYPGYKYQPRRPEVSRSTSFPMGNSMGMMTTFSINTPLSTSDLTATTNNEETSQIGSDTESCNHSDVALSPLTYQNVTFSPEQNTAMEIPNLNHPQVQDDFLFPVISPQRPIFNVFANADMFNDDSFLNAGPGYSFSDSDNFDPADIFMNSFLAYRFIPFR